MIYYLAHPYSNNPNDSIEFANEWTTRLRDMGFFVFSPIMHTHGYACHQDIYNPERQEEDYVMWDLQILNDLIGNVIILMSNTAYKTDGINRGWISIGCRTEFNFAKEKGIPIYELESFLNGTVVPIK